MHSVGQSNCALLVAEKDRRPSILRLHRNSGLVLNIEAKPPQSTKSRFFELLITRSIRRIGEFAVENRTYEQELRALGASSRIHVLGTLKASDAPETPQVATSPTRSAPRIAFVSVLAQELGCISRSVAEVRQRIGALQVLLVPRYIGSGLPWKSGKRIVKMALKRGLVTAEATSPSQVHQLLEGEGEAGVVYNSTGKVMSLLPQVDLAVVCGSLKHGLMSRAKGHNFMEPLAVGVPAVVGPLTVNWQHSVDEFVEEGTLITTTAGQLAGIVADLLEDECAYDELCQRINSSKLLAFHQASCSRVADLVCRSPWLQQATG